MADEWVEVQDKASGKAYYYNRKTRETTWNKPATLVEKASAAAAATPAVQLPPDWYEASDPNTGTKYYYNKKTKETSWTVPVAAAATSPSAAAVAARAASEAPAAAAAAAAPQRAVSEGPNQAAPAASTVTKSTSSAALATGGTETGGVGADKTQRRQRTGTVSPDGAWEEVIDPTSQKTYWYNRNTKATAWVLPSSAKISQEEQNALAHLAMSDKKTDDDEEQRVPKLEAEDLERPSDRMFKLKQALNEKELADQARKKEQDGDEDDDESFEFRFAKHRHGFINRVFRLGDAFDEQKLLTFKKSLIKKALLKKNRDLDEEAVQAFKNVMSYMGDRKTSKSPSDHARKLLSNAMSNPAGLRDEIYLQLCKQTTNNPKIASTIKGWELMMYCLASFPPSKQLKKFLLTYFQTNADSEETDEKVKAFAKEGLNRLEKIVSIGQRKEIPSALELECIRNMKPVPIRINLENGTFKTLQVDAYTFASDVETMLVHKLNLTLSSPFALYESNATDTNMERILEPKDRVLDIMAAWDKAPEVEEIKEVAPQGPIKKKQDLLKKQDSKTKIVVGPQFNQFIYKAKLVLKTSDPDVMADPEAVNLIYIQAIHDIVTARYPVKEKDITVLAALQLQATFGDFQPDSHGPGWLVPKLPEFMPEELLLDKKGKKSDQQSREWEQKILEKYSKITGFTSLEAKLNYLDYVQEWPFYGATFFTVEQRQFKDYPSPLTVGITCEGVILMHPAKKTLLENYPYTDIVTWGHSDERFIVVVGNIVQQRKLMFKTKSGKAMNNLIHDYVKFKVKNKVAGRS